MKGALQVLNIIPDAQKVAQNRQDLIKIDKSATSKNKDNVDV